ncbi:DUF6236 family protein [Actinomadura meridiana]
MIYYPTINPPTPILHQALLYWDRIATVVPRREWRIHLNDRTREVLDAGFYIPAEVELDPRGASERIIQAVDKWAKRTPSDLILGRQDEGVHTLLPLKAGIPLSMFLIDSELGRGDPFGGPLFVSNAVQTAVISALIREAVVDLEAWGRADCHFHPCTERPPSFNVAYDPRPLLATDDAERPQRIPCWKVDIGGLLPVPHHDVLLSDLIAFRERYADERRRLMEGIDLLVGQLGSAHAYPDEVFAALKRELDAALADLSAAGKARRIDWIRRPVSVVLGLASAYAGSKVVPDAGWLLGAVSGYAINIASTSVRNGPTEIGRDVGYLYRVEQQLKSA